MTDLQRLQIAFDLLWTQYVGVSKQLEEERKKNAVPSPTIDVSHGTVSDATVAKMKKVLEKAAV